MRSTKTKRGRHRTTKFRNSTFELTDSMSVVRGGRRAFGLLRQLNAATMPAAGGVAPAASAASTSKAYCMALLQSRRSSGTLPSDLERAANKTRFPTSSRLSGVASEPTTSASVKEEIVDEATAKLHGEQQDVVSNFMFPWERRQMQGRLPEHVGTVVLGCLRFGHRRLSVQPGGIVDELRGGHRKGCGREAAAGRYGAPAGGAGPADYDGREHTGWRRRR